MAASPCAKNILRMLEAHFWKKIRMLSLDEKIHLLIKEACREMFIYLLGFQRGMTYATLNDSNRFTPLAVLASYR